MEYCVFSKHLQTMGAEELGKTLAKLGLEGVDLTVREGGISSQFRLKTNYLVFRMFWLSRE